MSRTRKTASDRKDEIVRTAVRLAARLGPDRVTTQQLADAVGISQPAIFRHFPSKADIWLAVGETIAARMRVDESADRTADPAGRIAGLATRHLGQIAANPAIPAILFSRELHAENELLRRHFEQVMNNRRAGFSALVSQGIALGQFSEKLNPDDAASLVLAAIQGVAMRWSLENHGFDLQSEGGRLIALLLEGFRTTKP